jgi:hypothetical protein
VCALDREAFVEQEIVDAELNLAQSLRGRLVDASLSLHPDGVDLHGIAGSYYVTQMAQHAVKEHVSLPLVANEIDVLTARSDRRP